MKKKLCAVLIMITLVLFAGCAKHEHTWTEATCTDPKTCTECEETEGEALGHKFSEATCTEPSTCSVCDVTQGEALGHDAPELTCTSEAICNYCGEMVPAPGHKFSAATCTEPQICAVCEITEGEALGHTTTSGVCSRCGNEIYETVSGRGDDVVSDITVGDGIYRIHFTNSGSSNFIVRSYDASDSRSLLVNKIGSYDGYVLLPGTPPYKLEIKSSGRWNYTVERLTSTSESSFSGRGDYVTNMFSATSGTWQFTHSGRSNFIVWLYTTSGRDLLVNEIGSYDGKIIVTIPSGSAAFFEINADGNWTAEPVN